MTIIRRDEYLQVLSKYFLEIFTLKCSSIAYSLWNQVYFRNISENINFYSSNNNCKPSCTSRKKKRKAKLKNMERNSYSESISKSSYLPPESEYLQVSHLKPPVPGIVNEGLCIILEGDTAIKCTQVSQLEEINQTKTIRNSSISKNSLQPPVCTVSFEDNLSMTSFRRSNNYEQIKSITLDSLQNFSLSKTQSAPSSKAHDSRSHCIYCIINRLQKLPPCCLEKAINTFLQPSLSDCSERSACREHVK